MHESERRKCAVAPRASQEDGEVWRPIPSKPGFQASSLGRIRAPSGRILSAHKHIGGYRRVALCIPRRKARRMGVPHQCKYLVHRLVCEAFHGPAPTPEHIAAHANHIGDDNRPGNLRWATTAEKLADMIRDGRWRLHASGPNRPRSSGGAGARGECSLRAAPRVAR